MNKERFIRLYVKLNIFVGIMLLLFVFIFTNALPEEFSSLLETNVFAIRFIQLPEDIIFPNTPLYVFLLLAIVNIILLFRVGDTNDVEEKPLQTVVFYNMILSFMLVIGQIAFVLMLPESVSGLIKNRFLFIAFENSSGSFTNVAFLSYILVLVYLGYNIVVNHQVRIPAIEEEEEIYYTSEDLQDLENSNEE